MVEDLPRCDFNSFRPDQDTFEKAEVETPQLSLPNFAPNSAKFKSVLEAANAAVVGRETFSHPEIKSKPGTCKDEHVQLNSLPLEDQHQQGIEAVQKEAIFKAATLEIQSVLRSCTDRKDNITIDDMDLVHKKFGYFMRSHPTLSECYIMLTGGTTEASPAVSLPPLLLPSQPAAATYEKDGPPPCPHPAVINNHSNVQPMLLNRQPMHGDRFERPGTRTLKMDGNYLPAGVNAGYSQQHYNYVPGASKNEESQTVDDSLYRYESNGYLANSDSSLFIDTSTINRALSEKLRQLLTHPTGQSLSADADETQSISHYQSAELAASALVSFLQQQAEKPPKIAAPPASGQGNSHPSSRNLRRMGLTPSEELFAGLPDRRPYTRPERPYTGAARGRPVGSGHSRRRNNNSFGGLGPNHNSD
jgi:hypothetical protein